jgi:hypothetical protein
VNFFKLVLQCSPQSYANRFPKLAQLSILSIEFQICKVIYKIDLENKQDGSGEPTHQIPQQEPKRGDRGDELGFPSRTKGGPMS